jgi:hypothetical protein
MKGATTMGAAQAVTRVMMVGLGFGFGWIFSKLAVLLGASPTAQWWAFWVPAGMLTAHAVSGFIADAIPIPRGFVYLALLAAAGFYACSTPQEVAPVVVQEAESPQRGFHFTTSLEQEGRIESTVIGGLRDRDACEQARKIYQGEGLKAGLCERDNK